MVIQGRGLLQGAGEVNGGVRRGAPRGARGGAVADPSCAAGLNMLKMRLPAGQPRAQ